MGACPAVEGRPPGRPDPPPAGSESKVAVPVPAPIPALVRPVRILFCTIFSGGTGLDFSLHKFLGLL